MQYALVENKKRTAEPNVRGTCDFCGQEMIPKCGTRIRHHWAHKGKKKCDPWWENETDWHREWKNNFPEEWREILHKASDGQIHRADIKTPSNIVVEVQNSPMSDQERISREEFYQEMVWVINGTSFRKNFDLYHRLPNPDSDLAKDKKWSKSTREMRGASTGMYTKPSMNRPNDTMAQMFSTTDIREQIYENYTGHHQYDWIKPRATWLDANCPVFIDFGDDFLLRLVLYGEFNLPAIQSISKASFIEHIGSATKVENFVAEHYELPDYYGGQLHKRGDIRGVLWEQRSIAAV